MCQECGNTICCCPEKRVSLAGKKGDQGPKGGSVYIYVGYATNVVPGTPDVVTGFSTTTPECWMAIKTSYAPLTIAQTIFQGLWQKICGTNGTNGANGTNGTNGSPGATGPAGPPGTPLASAYDSDVLSFALSTANSNLNADVPTGNSITVTATGTYVINTQIEYTKINYPTMQSIAGNFVLTIKVNGVAVSYSLDSLNNVAGDYEFSPKVFVRVALTIGDIVTTTVKLQTVNTDETVGFSASKSKLLIQQLS